MKSEEVKLTVINQAFKNPNVQALYQIVDATTPITINITNGDYWSSSTSNGVTVIEAGRASDPAAAMMHELLHANMKIQGFKQYKTLLTTSDRGLLALDVLNALDNELQHHRMFPDFVAAAFRAEYFYSDQDHKTFLRLRRKLRKMNQQNDIVDYFLIFLSVIAPGGHGTASQRGQLRTYLFQRCGPAKQATLEAIEVEIAAWVSAPLQDHSRLLHSILLKLDINDIWVATGTNFPSDGFFVGNPITEAAAEVFLRGKGLL